MARKTAIRITNAEVRKTEHRRDAAKDRRRKPSAAIDDTGLMPNGAARRARLGLMEPRDLLKLARSAARLELRGAMYSADDRADVAAAIMLRVLESTGGAMPRHDSERVQLGRLCGDAKNLRRSIDAERRRDQIEAAERALEPAAMIGEPDLTPAKAAAILAKSGAKVAAQAATAICERLGLPADPDSAPWTLFYVWARNTSPEACAAERGVSWGAWRVRMTRGAKFVRGFYGAAELAARLTLGAVECDDGIVYVLADDSRTAHGRTPLLADAPRAPHWRTPNYPRPESPTTARALCAVSRCKVRPKRERERAKGDALAATAAALTSLARQHARQSRRREHAASARTSLPAGITH